MRGQVMALRRRHITPWLLQSGEDRQALVAFFLFLLFWTEQLYFSVTSESDASTLKHAVPLQHHRSKVKGT